MRTLIPYIRQQRRALAVTFALATVSRLLVLADPQILRVLVDRYVLRAGSLSQPAFLRGVLVLIVASVVVGLMARTFRTMQEYSIGVVARRVGAMLYAQSIAHSLLLPYRAFETRRSGELLDIILRSRQDAENGVGGAVNVYLGVVSVLAVSIYAFTLHPLLGVLHLVGLPLAGAVMLAISLPIRRRQREIALETAALSGSATEAVRNVEVLKSLGAETREIARIHALNERILSLEMGKLRLVRRFTFLEGIIFHSMRAVFLGVMLWLVYHREITTGEFLSLFLYTSLIFAAIAESGAAVARYQEARARFSVLDTVLDQPGEDRGHGREALGPITSVVFAGVSLAYDGAQAPALRDIDVELRAGDTVAFVGRSGAGKSSLVKLLVALYAPSEGALLVNGRDLRAVDLDAFRERVGLVAQETQLFAGTLRENLQIGRPQASDGDCLRALDEAAATSILTRGPEGLDTRLGEGAVRLSGGERQRIAIARALVRRPDLLIFDEATTGLDAITERAVSDTVRALAGSRRLTVLVTHRLATITHADSIHVLDGGAIVESGAHEDLLAGNGLYAALWREQQAAGTSDGVPAS